MQEIHIKFNKSSTLCCQNQRAEQTLVRFKQLTVKGRVNYIQALCTAANCTYVGA